VVKIVWTTRAFNQLENAVTYIKQESSQHQASLALNKILDSISSLSEFPLRGAIEPLLKHKKSEYRYLVVFSYKIIYRLSEEKV
jgi:toxin ParE1/3/4